MTPHDPTTRFSGDVRAQASTIGVVLVLAITLFGASVVVAIGSEAMADTERATSVSKAEHAMTQFDSRVAMVGLGETRSQRVRLSNSADGVYATNADDGWMRIRHLNYTGVRSDTNDNETIYNESLGTMTYENGDVTVAYQGGGVWRHQDGGTTMLSPPEFHYRGATLTLPIVRVTNDDAAGGPTDAFVTRVGQSTRVYPNEAGSYVISGNKYRNPVLNGTVEVTVHSTYYKGWADFFDTRTAGTVSVNHANETATVELKTVNEVGDFEMATALSEGLNVRGQAEGHSVNEFEVRFKKSHGTFNNMYFSFYAESGPHRYETVMHVKQPVNCKHGVEDDDTLDLYTFYRNTDENIQHEWYRTGILANGGDIRLECTDDETVVAVMNFTAEKSQTYGEVDVDEVNGEGTYYDWGDTVDSPATFGHQNEPEDQDVNDNPITFSDGEQTSTNHLTRHYFALLGNDFTLYAQTGTGNRGGTQVDVDASGGTLEYDAGEGGYYITYLHITENEVKVELE